MKEKDRRNQNESQGQVSFRYNFFFFKEKCNGPRFVPTNDSELSSFMGLQEGKKGFGKCSDSEGIAKVGSQKTDTTGAVADPGARG